MIYTENCYVQAIDLLIKLGSLEPIEFGDGHPIYNHNTGVMNEREQLARENATNVSN